MNRPQTSLEIESRRRPQAFEYVVEQLRREILLGLITPGQALPAERQLAQLLSVGRATVQSAIAVLRQEGLVETRRGRGGGTFVTAATEVDAKLTQTMRETLRPIRGALLEALAFRTEIEPLVCSLAALFRTDADLAAMRTAAMACREAPDDQTFMMQDRALHSAIATASHNRFYSDSLHRVRAVLEELLAALPESELWHARSHREHSAIIAAVEERDGSVAADFMREHAGATDIFAKALLEVL